MEEIGMTKRKNDLPEQAGPHQGETKTGMPPEHSDAALGTQPKPGREAGGVPIVGIGASAGGLAAFEAFFSGMPAGSDPGMAFVLVQHLAPDHKSILSDLIRRYTRTCRYSRSRMACRCSPIAPISSRLAATWRF